MKKIISIFLMVILLTGLLTAAPTVYAGALLNQILNPDGSWGTYSGGSFQRQGVQNLWAQTTNPLNIAATNWEPYKIDPPPSGATHAIPFNLAGAAGGNSANLINSIQLVGQNGKPIDISRSWKTDVSIELDFALLGDAANFNNVENVRIGVSVFGNDWRTCTLTVPLSDYAVLSTDNLKVWQHVTVPLSDLLDHGVGIYWGDNYKPDGLSFWTETEWTGINGITLLADCVGASSVYAYLADVKFTSDDGSTPPPPPPPSQDDTIIRQVITTAGAVNTSPQFTQTGLTGITASMPTSAIDTFPEGITGGQKLMALTSSWGIGWYLNPPGSKWDDQRDWKNTASIKALIKPLTSAAGNVEIGIMCYDGDWKATYSTIPLSGYINTTDKLNQWQEIVIPISVFDTDSANFVQNNQWISKSALIPLINGLVFVGSAVPANADCLLFSDIKVVENSGTPPPADIPVTGISDITGPSEVSEGMTGQYSAAIEPSDATNKNITWSVTNGTGSATINASGLLTGQASGTVSVKATSQADSAISKTKTITIKAAPAPPAGGILLKQVIKADGGLDTGINSTGLNGFGDASVPSAVTSGPFPDGITGARQLYALTSNWGIGYFTTMGAPWNTSYDWKNKAYLDLWIKPLNSAAANAKIGIFAGGNDWTSFATVTSLSGYLNVGSGLNVWQHISIPVSELTEFLNPRHPTLTEYSHSLTNGFLILGNSMSSSTALLEFSNVKLIEPDLSQPKASFEKNDATVGPNETIQLTFDKPMDTNTFIPPNFSISGGISVTGVTWSTDTKTVTLQFDSLFSYDEAYTLQILDGVKGENGNSVDEATRTFSFTVMSEAVYEFLSDTKLNSNSLTEAEAKTLLEDARLGLDLSDYNLSNVNKNRVISLFLKYKASAFENLEQVQELFDKAVGMELFNSEASPSNMSRWINKYGTIAGIEQKFLDDYNSSSLTQTSKNQIASLMCSADLSDETKINESFARANLVGLINNPNNTWSMVRTILTVTYKDYINFDPLALTAAGVSEAEFYKAMLNKNYSGMPAIEADIPVIIASLKTTTTGGSGGGSGGGGGGGGGGTRSGYVTAPNTPLTLPEIWDNEEAPRGFSDLGSVSWAVNAINILSNRGIISPANVFRPNDNITRAEFTKLVVLCFDLYDENAACSFSDVEAGSWAYPFIASAKNAGIINGMSDTIFAPNDNISRQDMTVIVFKALGVDSDEDNTTMFDDADSIAEYAVPSVSAMSSLGIINGIGENMFAPRSFATRAESSVIIHRTIEALEKKEGR